MSNHWFQTSIYSLKQKTSRIFKLFLHHSGGLDTEICSSNCWLFAGSQGAFCDAPSRHAGPTTSCLPSPKVQPGHLCLSEVCFFLKPVGTSLRYRCFTPLSTREIGSCVKKLFGEEEEEMHGQCDYFSLASLGYPVKN